MHRLVLAQVAAMSLVLAQGGSFVLKLFDVETPCTVCDGTLRSLPSTRRFVRNYLVLDLACFISFVGQVSLYYVAHQLFSQVTMLKPVTSRPASSER